MAGLSREGLEIKRQIEVIEDLKSNAVPLFQDLVPVGDVVDTSDDSTLGRIIGLYSDPLSELWELAQAVYLAFDPDSSFGTSLDDLVSLAGIVRRGASPTRADAYVWGNVDLQLQNWHSVRSKTTGQKYKVIKPIVLSPNVCHGVGMVVKTFEPSYQYTINYRLTSESSYIQASYTSSSSPTPEGILLGLMEEINTNHPSIKAYEEDGLLWVKASTELRLLEFFTGGGIEIEKVIGITVLESEDNGAFVQPPHTIDSIITPTFGWDGVTNPFDAVLGGREETDEELRERFRNSKFQRATNILEALYSSLKSVDGLMDVVIYENYTEEVDEKGLPPKSFSVIADGGLDSDVAISIWRNRPTGIRGNGDVAVDIIDAHGYTRTIRFYRPEDIFLKIRMSLTRFSDFPPQGNEVIKSNLVDLVNGVAIGNPLIFSRLYTPINKIQGHQVDSLEVSIDGTEWFSSNVVANLNQKIRLLEKDIEIN